MRVKTYTFNKSREPEELMFTRENFNIEGGGLSEPYCEVLIIAPICRSLDYTKNRFISVRDAEMLTKRISKIVRYLNERRSRNQCIEIPPIEMYCVQYPHFRIFNSNKYNGRLVSSVFYTSGEVLCVYTEGKLKLLN